MRNFGSQVRIWLFHLSTCILIFAKIMSLMAETVTTCLKLTKSSNVCLLLYSQIHPNHAFQSAIVRYNAITTLEKSLSTAKRAVTDSLAKDIVKQTRSALGDKSLPIIRAASSVSIQPLF